MGQNSTAIIRNLHFTDLPRLRDFFLKAYGPGTIFQDPGFLEWYFFGCTQKPEQEAGGSIICLAADQKTIVSFYGGLRATLLFDGERLPVTWGVNAFVLPDYRGQNISARSLEMAKKQSQLHGVIGFTAKTAGFYKALGYNMFGFRRFSRYIKVISESGTKSIFASLHPNKVFNLHSTFYSDTINPQAGNSSVIRLTSENIRDFEIDLAVPVRLTTHRDKEYLLNRFLLHPYIRYELFAAVLGGKILAFCSCRDEVLQPLGTSVSRIVDLFGKADYVPALLSFMVTRAQEKAHAYVDFSAFGTLYSKETGRLGFIKLDEEQYAVLPQVTAPIEPRPNMEYIGLHSNRQQSGIQNLSRSEVYFTRADSDRDRIARITQLQDLKVKYESE